MTVEGKLQSEGIKWLKSKGAYVIKTRPGPGTPTGCPDVVFMFQYRWGVIEFKSGPSAAFRPGQRETLQRLSAGNRFVYVAEPQTWPLVRDELEALFFQ